MNRNTKREGFRPRTLAFTAGQVFPLNSTGKFLHILKATDPVYVSVDDGEFIELTRGRGFETDFQRLKIKSDTAQTVQWVTGEGRFVDSAENVNVTTSATIAPGNTYTPTADVTITALSTGSLIAANANRLAVTVTNPVSNSNTFRLGVPLNVGAGKGDILEPGDSLTLAYIGALDAYNSGATDEALVVNEVSDI